ncbi:TolC family protein [sulfur-oxidizing endosymbiont of Gigantopelta aegis]|uniref:TolC family protein n=1 Tax=sulfur-oxidizing endosymbiont of Gigantopelta aegis TaxID=2794934 RepID=UPI0018DDC99E|nr:TolC family protein [sulfur-oxidizing endosymbiont of Gigantopelta aegis]
MHLVFHSKKQLLALIIGFNLIGASNMALAAPILTLQAAETMALEDEPEIISQQWQMESLSAQSIADGQLNDPKMQVALANMPTDTFDFDQENMTQLKVGIIQQFPSGDTLSIKQAKTQKQSELFLSKIADRKLSIIKEVRLTYFEIYYWEEAKKTIVQNQRFFSQLVEIVQSMFSVGRNNQQDLIRAQLELSRLDDRIVKITQKINMQRSKLSRWVRDQNSTHALSSQLPELSIPEISDEFETLSQLFYSHPKIQEIDKQIDISREDIALAKEAFKPGWALNVGYAYRDNKPKEFGGGSRSDFVSAGVTFDLPMFTANRQDKKLLSKEHKLQALKDKRVSMLRQLVASLQQQQAVEEQLQNRHQLYINLLMPQAKQQTQASLLAYQSDRGDFADVMRAYIDDLNVKLDERRIAVDHLQSKAKILYFTSSFEQNNTGT